MKAYAFWLASALACSALGDVASALRLVTDWRFADQADQTEIVGNVFENGPAAAQFSLSRDCRMIGNHYSGCRHYFATGEGKSNVSVNPRTFNE